MLSFVHDGLDIAYLDEGMGDPILLVHGFASNAATNWVAPSWTTTLVGAGYRVVALDNRGHGASSKPHDPVHYRSQLMAEDVRALMDHLGIMRADVMGYSMGARIAALLTLEHPQRVRSLILGGLGDGLVYGVGDEGPVIEALEAGSLEDVTHARGRLFRAFADQTKSDRLALAACMRSMRVKIPPHDVRRIATPTLIAVGTRDSIAGDPHALAALMPNARALDIPGRDHMPAVGDKVFKAGVLAFLRERP
jgi:pimeloyl-ACP methyl ester carboxylesterase